MKGCICLDIDGTITSDPFCIPQEVINCFEKLYEKGWRFLFSTGRPYAFASKLFQGMNIPFFLSLQNGADLLEMPSKKLLSKEHLSFDFIPKLEEVYRDLEEDFLVYAGWEKGDFCYFRPHRFSVKMLEHLEVIQSIFKEPWQPVEDFDCLRNSSFPLIKSLGSLDQMDLLNDRLSLIPEIQATCIQDPLARKRVYLNLITSEKASKGAVIRKLRKLFPLGSLFIAAGDDQNDISMLKEADKVIVMKGSAKNLLELADLVAEPAENMGIIDALIQITGEI